jgi:hypothetical protein
MAPFNEDIGLQLTPIHAAGLLALVLIIPVYQGYRNWRAHQARQRMAVARQWRYSSRGWRANFKSTFSMAGSTPSGVIWQLKRVDSDRRLWLVWTAPTRLLPYGTLVILPRHVDRLPAHLDKANLRQMEVGSQQWQMTYELLTTHDLLGQRFFNREIELALLDWPVWPASGALHDIVWQRHQLRIRCRLHTDPLCLEKIVILGTMLIENGVQWRQAS